MRVANYGATSDSDKLIDMPRDLIGEAGGSNPNCLVYGPADDFPIEPIR